MEWQRDREVSEANINELESFLQKVIDPRWRLDWEKEKGFVHILYNRRTFGTVYVEGESFLGCLKDVVKRLE